MKFQDVRNLINFATNIITYFIQILFMEANNELKKYKKITYILGVLVLILLATTIYSLLNVRTVIVERDKAENTRIELQTELDSLLINHERIKEEYGELSVQLLESDSIIQANAAEIRSLISRQADYNRIKKKLDLLRGISQDYVVRLDSISKVNEELVTENKKIKQDVDRYKQTTTTLEEQTENLKGQISNAARLKAYSINARAVNVKSGGKKEEQTDRVRRTDRIKVSFTLSENPVAEEGTKNIYCRIARPDGKVLYIDDSDAYSFEANGEKLQYSIKQQINYDKKATNLSLTWDVKDAKTEIIAGRYYAMVYVDGYKIGEGTFELR